MFTLQKLKSLPPKTRLRKLTLLLQQAEQELVHDRTPDIGLFISCGQLDDLPEALREGFTALKAYSQTPAALRSLRRSLWKLRHAILISLNSEPSEWDLLDPDTGALEVRAAVFPASVYIEDLRSPYNVGAVFRTAEAFGVEEILLSPDTPPPTHRRALRTARGCSELLPWKRSTLADLEGRDGVFALETGGIPLQEFPFPPRGTVLIGSEELGLSPDALCIAEKGSGRVSIPMAGSKRSLNAAVAFGVLMWNWYAFLSSASRNERNARM